MRFVSTLLWTVPIWLGVVTVLVLVFGPGLLHDLGRTDTIRRFAIVSTASFSAILILAKVIGTEIANARNDDDFLDDDDDH